MDEIVKKIFNAGVVGAGGAGFPSHVKVQCKADVVIANGAECEPLLSNDKLLIMHFTSRVLEGLTTVARQTGAQRSVVSIKGKYSDVVTQLQNFAREYNAEVFLLQNYYPAGDELEIVQEVTGKIVPEMGIPPHVGVVVHNIETLLNISYAIEGRPVTHRYVSLLGKVRNPAVYRVPIGTLIADFVELTGGFLTDNPAVLIGGAMMGQIADDLETPVAKTTSAVIVLDADHPLISEYKQAYSFSLLKAKSACTQCVLCTELCSRNQLGHRLFPHKIMRLADLALAGDSELARSAFLCSDCGCCEYACPMGLSPRKVIRVIKKSAKKFAPKDFRPALHPFRSIRRIPVERLIYRLDLAEFNIPVKLSTMDITPHRVKLPLKQHIGVPAEYVKGKKQVKQGDLVADVPRDQLGSRVHASMSGEIVKFTPDFVEIKVNEG
ncbi:SLBB domain-containing protein [candidate division KSB1 bacterium]|nr:SLBB domain-containing protein [candidate division KSB1 bacterium]